MDCQEVQSLLCNDLLNELDSSTQARIKEHLDQCPVCARLVHERRLVDDYYKAFIRHFSSPQVLPASFTSRVYEKIQSRRQRSTKYLVYKSVATAALILIGLVSYFLLTTSPSHVLEGTLYAERDGETILYKDSLPVGQALKTKEGQSAKFKLRDDSIIEMSPDTILTIKNDSRLSGRLLNLERGELHCQVVKGGGFRIQMLGAELKTLGTEFAVRMSINKKEITTLQNKLVPLIISACIKVSVFSGRVCLTADKSQREIVAGETLIKEVNPGLPVEIQTEVKYLVGELGDDDLVRQKMAFDDLTRIGYPIVRFLEQGLLSINPKQKIYIDKLQERFIGPEVIWKQQLSKVSLMPDRLTVATDQVYLVQGANLYALDIDTGNIIWNLRLDDFNSTPVLREGVIYLGSLGGSFFAVDAANGKILWQKVGLGAIQSTPVIFDDTLYIGSSEPGAGRGRFYALDSHTGDIKWVFYPSGMVAGSQGTVYKDMVLFGDWDGKLYALNRENGQRLWQYQTRGKIITTPRVVGDLVYIGSDDGHLYAVSALNGEEQWSFPADSHFVESPIEANQMLYWGTEHKIYAFDLARRQLTWTYNRERYTKGHLVLVASRLYFGTDSGRLIALNADTGEVAWYFEISQFDEQRLYERAGSACIFNDILCITSRSAGDKAIDNMVYAFRIK